MKWGRFLENRGEGGGGRGGGGGGGGEGREGGKEGGGGQPFPEKSSGSLETTRLESATSPPSVS